jgi:benzoate membrane transport protein
MPVFSLKAIITAAPVFFVLITIQSNLPSIRFLQSHEYDPPELVISVISGIGTIIGSLFGPIGVSLSLPATSLVAGPGAGDKSLRHKSVYISGLVAVFIGFFASIAVGLASAIPLVLLLTLAGISVVNVLENALQQITKGPLILGPLFTFTIAISEISFLGYGPYFWALVIGTGVSLLLEKDALNKLRNQVEQS